MTDGQEQSIPRLFKHHLWWKKGKVSKEKTKMKMKMKKLFSILATALLTASAFAQTEVVLNINHLFGENPYVYDTPVTVEAGYQMKVTRLEYYLGNFVITHDGGQELNLNETHVLVDANDAETYSLGTHNVTQIENISFSVGVIEPLNHLDPAEYELENPLAPQLPSMHWGWAAGYRFLAFEGKSGEDLTTGYEIHALGDENLMNQTHALSVEATNGVAAIYLDADYFKLVNNLDVSQGLIVHGTTDEAIDALLNMRSLVFSVGAPVSVAELDAKEWNVYPNPANENVTLQLDASFQGAQLDIVNLHGQAVLTIPNVQNKQTINVSNLSAGMYFLQLQSNTAVTGKMLSVN